MSRGYRSGEALALNVFSDLCRRLGEAEKSEAQVRETPKICREIGDRVGEASTLRCLSRCRLGQGQLAEAIRYSPQALVINRERDDEFEAVRGELPASARTPWSRAGGSTR